MGANLIIRTHDYCSHADLKAWVKSCIEEESFEHGHSAYSGYWAATHGLTRTVEVKVYPNYEAAYEVIASTTDKSSGLLAVPALFQPQIDQSVVNADPVCKQIKDEVDALYARVNGFSKTVFDRALAAKSALRSCSHCGSKISVKHMDRSRGTGCPVCKTELLYTATDFKNLKALNDRLEKEKLKLEAAMATLRKKLAKTDPKYAEKKIWVVGGWCRC